jgi:hypothetical protein
VPHQGGGCRPALDISFASCSRPASGHAPLRRDRVVGLTTGLGASRIRRSYRPRISGQSVSAAVGPRRARQRLRPAAGTGRGVCRQRLRTPTPSTMAARFSGCGPVAGMSSPPRPVRAAGARRSEASVPGPASQLSGRMRTTGEPIASPDWSARWNCSGGCGVALVEDEGKGPVESGDIVAAPLVPAPRAPTGRRSFLGPADPLRHGGWHEKAREISAVVRPPAARGRDLRGGDRAGGSWEQQGGRVIGRGRRAPGRRLVNNRAASSTDSSCAGEPPHCATRRQPPRRDP